MGEFNTVGLEDIIDAFSRREAATVKEIKARCAMQQSALWQSTAQVATLHALI